MHGIRMKFLAMTPLNFSVGLFETFYLCRENDKIVIYARYRKRARKRNGI